MDKGIVAQSERSEITPKGLIDAALNGDETVIGAFRDEFKLKTEDARAAFMEEARLIAQTKLDDPTKSPQVATSDPNERKVVRIGGTVKEGSDGSSKIVDFDLAVYTGSIKDPMHGRDGYKKDAKIWDLYDPAEGADLDKAQELERKAAPYLRLYDRALLEADFKDEFGSSRADKFNKFDRKLIKSIISVNEFLDGLPFRYPSERTLGTSLAGRQKVLDQVSKLVQTEIKDGKSSQEIIDHVAFQAGLKGPESKRFGGASYDPAVSGQNFRSMSFHSGEIYDMAYLDTRGLSQTTLDRLTKQEEFLKSVGIVIPRRKP